MIARSSLICTMLWFLAALTPAAWGQPDDPVAGQPTGPDGEAGEEVGRAATVAGGFENSASGAYAAVGGGWSNRAPGYVATLGGGWQNVAAGDAATVAGGQYNQAAAAAAAVGGGWNNAASGDAATVPGGRENTAAGAYSLAAGRNARALHPGAFVWSDSSDEDFSSTSDDQFLIRARGNVGIDVANPMEKLTVGGNVRIEGRVRIGGGDPGAGKVLVSDETGWASWQEWTSTDEPVASPIPSLPFIEVEGDMLTFRLGGVSVLRLDASSQSPSMIAGHPSNAILSPSFGSTIAGGGREGHPNLIEGHFGFIGGGMGNRMQGPFSMIGGGFENQAGGRGSTVGGGIRNQATNMNSTVSGGSDNVASGHGAAVGGGRGNTVPARYATVAGGHLNTASGPGTSVGGGSSNVASGFTAVVPGGLQNLASGDYSLAAGRRARSAHTGSFVWADSTDADVSTTQPNQFVARASGGTRIYTDPTSLAGVELAPGAGSWSSLSDQAAKENVEPAEPVDVLHALLDVPVSTWNYRTQDPSVRHIGPSAQDFYHAFALGEGPTRITDMDAAGVALTSIQGLYGLLEEKSARIEQLEAENRTLTSRVEAMESRINRMQGPEDRPAAPAP